jgi:hypothetical protein
LVDYTLKIIWVRSGFVDDVMMLWQEDVFIDTKELDEVMH